MTDADRLAALERRVRELEDEREIRNLLGWYAYYADGRHDEEWVDLWTEDGVYDLSIGRWSARLACSSSSRTPTCIIGPASTATPCTCRGPTW